MKNARNTDNTKMFWSGDYLTVGQIRSQYGIFTQNIKKGKPAVRFLTACLSGSSTDHELSVQEASAPLEEYQIEEGIMDNMIDIAEANKIQVLDELNKVEDNLESGNCPLLVSIQLHTINSIAHVLEMRKWLSNIEHFSSFRFTIARKICRTCKK